MELWLLLLLVGVAGGTIGSVVGLGGGIIIVPSLILIGTYTSLLPNLTPQLVVGTSMLILIVVGLSSTLAYIKQKKVDYRAGLIFFIGSGPGAYVGAIVNNYIESDLFYIFFGVFMILISIILSVRKYMKPSKKEYGMSNVYVSETGEKFRYSYHPIMGIAIAFVVGIFSGLFGIGGGSLLVPMMLLLFRFPTPVAVATSMFLVFISSTIGSIAHIRLGNVEWLWALWLVPGAWIGGKIGAFLNKRLADSTVIIILRLLLVVVGVRVIFQGL